MNITQRRENTLFNKFQRQTVTNSDFSTVVQIFIKVEGI